jgi:hypothetical protein
VRANIQVVARVIDKLKRQHLRCATEGETEQGAPRPFAKPNVARIESVSSLAPK